MPFTPAEAEGIAIGASLFLEALKNAPALVEDFRALYESWTAEHPLLRSLPPPESEEADVVAQGDAALDAKFGVKP